MLLNNNTIDIFFNCFFLVFSLRTQQISENALFFLLSDDYKRRSESGFTSKVVYSFKNIKALIDICIHKYSAYNPNYVSFSKCVKKFKIQ
jgi:hypothetical protein